MCGHPRTQMFFPLESRFVEATEDQLMCSITLLAARSPLEGGSWDSSFLPPQVTLLSNLPAETRICGLCMFD